VVITPRRSGAFCVRAENPKTLTQTHQKTFSALTRLSRGRMALPSSLDVGPISPEASYSPPCAALRAIAREGAQATGAREGACSKEEGTL
jgi:hypothetical protein